MRTKERHNGNKIIQSLQSAQVSGHVQIAAVEDTSVGADAIRHE